MNSLCIVYVFQFFISDVFHLVPTSNVAYLLENALLIEGVSRNRHALIDGNTKNYDWESGYTCHQIGSGCITIQLAQPYIIGSMRYAIIYSTHYSHTMNTIFFDQKKLLNAEFSAP